MTRRCAAYHEAGHCVATVVGYRHVWPKPQPLLRLVEISDSGNGQWVGRCAAARIVSDGSPALLEIKVISHLAGGIAEAMARGAHGRGEVLRFAIEHCCCDTDRVRAAGRLDQLQGLTGRAVCEQAYALRTRHLLLQHWDSVEAVASALVKHQRIEGREVERLIDDAA